jgi:hypothetical protein
VAEGNAPPAAADLPDWSPDSTHAQMRGDGNTARVAVESRPLHMTPSVGPRWIRRVHGIPEYRSARPPAAATPGSNKFRCRRLRFASAPERHEWGTCGVPAVGILGHPSGPGMPDRLRMDCWEHGRLSEEWSLPGVQGGRYWRWGYPWTVGRIVMSPISTSSGCSIANAMARATASGAMPSSSMRRRVSLRDAGSSM